MQHGATLPAGCLPAAGRAAHGRAGEAPRAGRRSRHRGDRARYPHVPYVLLAPACPLLPLSTLHLPGFKFSRASYLLSLLRPQIYSELELQVRCPSPAGPPAPPGTWQGDTAASVSHCPPCLAAAWPEGAPAGPLLLHPAAGGQEPAPLPPAGARHGPDPAADRPVLPKGCSGTAGSRAKQSPEELPCPVEQQGCSWRRVLCTQHSSVPSGHLLSPSRLTLSMRHSWGAWWLP